MNGCLKKTLIEMKSITIAFAVFVLVVGTLSVFSQNHSILSLYIIFSLIIPFTSVLSNSTGGWQTYEYMLPTSCEQSVSAVYIFGAVYNGIFFVGIIISNIAGGLICKAADGALDLPKPDDVTILGGEFWKLLLFFSFFALLLSGISCAYFYRYRRTSSKMVLAGLGVSLLISVVISALIGSGTVGLSWAVVIPTVLIALIAYPLSEKFSEFFYDKYRG